MRTRETLEQEIKTWDGVNKYLTRKARKELRELDQSEGKKKVKVKKDKDKYDFNNDGKVDKDDRSLAAKLLSSKKGRKNK